ncbi:MAG: hypothetical protein J6N72_10455, partial [Psychrobacter sp.]|nr:hypothetical protein [Psychrobacter sp.]
LTCKEGSNWLLYTIICFGQSIHNLFISSKDETLGTTTKIRQTAQTHLLSRLYWLRFLLSTLLCVAMIFK